jgi:hypothetical protein
VLDDSLRVADRLAIDYEHRYASLIGQRLDLRPAGPPLRDAHLIE